MIKRCTLALLVTPLFVLGGFIAPNVAGAGPAGAIHPSVKSVAFTASDGTYGVTIDGSGFGTPPGSLPLTGTTTVLRIEDEAQLGSAEWGYSGDSHPLTYVSWSNTRIELTGFGAAPGDSVVLAVWNTHTDVAGTWGGQVPGGVTGGPVIKSVSLNEAGGSLQNTQIVVQGSGFGPAPAHMPFTGDLNQFSFWDARGFCDATSAQFTAGANYFGAQPADAVTLTYKSWNDHKIVVSGFAGTYGSGCNALDTGDAVAVTVWNSAATTASAPQASWGGLMRPAPVVYSDSFTAAGTSDRVTVNGSGFDNAPVPLPYTGDLPYFVLENQAQLGHGEYGFTGDANLLRYETWYTVQPHSISQIQATGVQANAGDAVVNAVVQAGSGVVAVWGGNVTPVPPDTPAVTSVVFSGYGAGTQLIIKGSGFGPAPVAMPFTGDLDNFSFWDARSSCAGFGLFNAGGSYFGSLPADGVTLQYTSWTDSKIVINGFGGAYGQGCATVRPTDPVAITIWRSGDTSDQGPQTAWGGRIPKTDIPNPAG